LIRQSTVRLGPRSFCQPIRVGLAVQRKVTLLIFMSRTFAVVGFESGASQEVQLTRIPGRGLAAFLNSFLGLRSVWGCRCGSWTGGKTCISYAPQEPEIHSVTRPVSYAGCLCVFSGVERVFRVCLTTQKAFRRPTRQALIFHPRKTIKLQAKDCVRA